MSDTFTPQLINELEEIKSNTLLPLERRLVDTAVWFHKNRGRVDQSDLKRRVDFMEKTLDIFLELFAMQVQRIQTSESSRSPSLYTPRGIFYRP